MSGENLSTDGGAGHARAPLRVEARSSGPGDLALASPLAPGALGRRVAVVLPGAARAEDCARWAEGVLAARDAWVADFGGEQHTLGRAFYTHLEQDRLAAYFAGAHAADAAVERAAPGLAGHVDAIVASVTGGRVARRPDFCGPGVHVFPGAEKVARRGGVVHFDTEGLPGGHLARRAPALSVVLMLALPRGGASLRLWDVRWAGDDHVPRSVRDAAARWDVTYAVGTAVVFDSYVLHQIQPFRGTGPRISATAHAAETSRGAWETWF